MSHDDVVDSMGLGKAHDLFCRMTYRDVDVGLEGFVRVLGLHSSQHIVVMLSRLLNHRFRLNHATEFGRSHDRKDVHR
jgi:hypothetical protein